MNSVEKLHCWKRYFKTFKFCNYTWRLIDKLIHLNSLPNIQAVDIEIVKKAIYYAKKYHGCQKRLSGEPFYSHPLEVAYMISDYLFRTDIIVTAILHDTIEDTELTKEQIAQEFGAQIANQVMDLTRITEDGVRISAAAILEILYKKKKYDILLIKIFDRLHNMQTLLVKSSAKQRENAIETLVYFIPMVAHFGEWQLEQELVRLCCQVKGIMEPNFLQEQHHNDYY